MKEEIIKVVNEICAERYPWLLQDNKIEAHNGTAHVAFGGKNHDIYGWVSRLGEGYVATGYSPYGHATKEFDNLKDACLFCIQERFHFKK